MTNESSQDAWVAELAKQLQSPEFKESLQSQEFKKATEARLALMKKEEEVIEVAPWFGKTGLTTEIERELPRYLRREFGQSIFDTDSLKASELEYVGAFLEDVMTVHYWHISHGKGNSYAYVIVDVNGDSLGWGDKKPASGVKL